MEIRNENFETHYSTLLVVNGITIQFLLDLSVCYLLKSDKSTFKHSKLLKILHTL